MRADLAIHVYFTLYRGSFYTRNWRRPLRVHLLYTSQLNLSVARGQ